MYCPKCSSTIFGTKCPSCGIDTLIYKKIINLSNTLYNKGLSQAKIKDLSGAIESLNKSVMFNKNNTDARNLLGLIFYETGKIGEALKQWVISASLDKKENLAQQYINEIQKDARMLEKLNDAVNMYNQAIVYVQQKNEDMAIIQLKKALDLNPKFIDAMNLLSLCFLLQETKTKAIAYVERVLSQDTKNPIALGYANELSFKAALQNPQSVPNKVSKTAPPKAPVNTVKEKSFSNKFYLSEIISFIVGGLCAVLIIYALVIPDVTKKSELSISELKLSLDGANQILADTISKNNEKNSSLEAEIKRLNDEVKTQNEQIYVYERLQIVANASKLMFEKNYISAADLLHSADLKGIPQDVLEQAEEMKKEAYKQAATTLYSDGVNQYNRKEYEEAKVTLTKSLKYNEKETADKIIYYLGMTAKALENTAEARQHFQTVVDEYPNSSQFYRAKNELSRLPSS